MLGSDTPTGRPAQGVQESPLVTVLLTNLARTPELELRGHLEAAIARLRGYARRSGHDYDGQQQMKGYSNVA